MTESKLQEVQFHRLGSENCTQGDTIPKQMQTICKKGQRYNLIFIDSDVISPHGTTKFEGKRSNCSTVEGQAPLTKNVIEEFVVAQAYDC